MEEVEEEVAVSPTEVTTEEVVVTPRPEPLQSAGAGLQEAGPRHTHVTRHPGTRMGLQSRPVSSTGPSENPLTGAKSRAHAPGKTTTSQNLIINEMPTSSATN